MKTDLHFAVLVGINRYPGVTDLRNPRRDATDVAAWLTSVTGGRVPVGNVVCITAHQNEERDFSDPMRSRPRRDELDKAIVEIHQRLEDALADDASRWHESRLYLYASGHGIAPAFGVGALLFADCAPKAEYWASPAEFGDYRDYYEQSGRFREVIFFADCCRERRVLATSMRPSFSTPTESYGDTTDWLLAFAAEYGAQAFEPPAGEVDATRGFFTQALIDGLEGGAADPRTGEIRSDALGRYVKRSMDQLTRDTKYHQVPKIAGSDVSEPMILRAAELGPLPRKRRHETLAFPDGQRGPVELVHDGEVLPNRWKPTGGPWELELEEGSYIVRATGDEGHDLGVFEVIAKEQYVRL